MKKDQWLSFLAEKIRSQIQAEGVRSAQNWGLLLVALFAFGFATQSVLGASGRGFLYITKILFLLLTHAVLILGVYLPGRLQKGQKSFTRALGLRDLTSLITMTLVFILYSAITLSLAYQLASGASQLRVSGFFSAVAWGNVVAAGAYLAGFLFFLAGILFFPKALIKFAESGGRLPGFIMWAHAVLLGCTYFAYGEIAVVGSPSFFEQLRVSGLFILAMGALILFLGQILEGSSTAPLSALELDVAADKIERSEDILKRLKEAFALRRLVMWLKKTSHDIATGSHEIHQYLHEAVTLISEPKPTETQLRQVEDRYKRAEGLYKKIEKQNQRFSVSASFFHLLDVEREMIEEIKDQYSKELRHGKLELGSVRKKIDEKLVALKDAEKAELPEATVQELPLMK